MKKPLLRTFFALWPDAGVRAALAERATAAAKLCGGRPPRPDLLHLTLVFIGATPPERVEPLRDLMDATRIAAFTLRLDRTGWFRQSGVAWMGAQAVPEPLVELQHALARGASRLGFSLDVRPYVPHLTLARDARRAPLPAEIAPLEWRAGSFALVASDLLSGGPRYRILHEAPLSAIETTGAPAH